MYGNGNQLGSDLTLGMTRMVAEGASWSSFNDADFGSVSSSRRGNVVDREKSVKEVSRSEVTQA